MKDLNKKSSDTDNGHGLDLAAEADSDDAHASDHVIIAAPAIRITRSRMFVPSALSGK